MPSVPKTAPGLPLSVHMFQHVTARELRRNLNLKLPIQPTHAAGVVRKDQFNKFWLGFDLRLVRLGEDGLLKSGLVSREVQSLGGWLGRLKTLLIIFPNGYSQFEFPMVAKCIYSECSKQTGCQS